MWTLNVITCILVIVQYAMFNAFLWNCFNLVDTWNIALILSLKCDVTKFRISRPPLSHNVTLRWPPSVPLNVWRNLLMPPYQHNKNTVEQSPCFSIETLLLKGPTRHCPVGEVYTYRNKVSTDAILLIYSCFAYLFSDEKWWTSTNTAKQMRGRRIMKH